jgi:hypothetical protein
MEKDYPPLKLQSLEDRARRWRQLGSRRVMDVGTLEQALAESASAPNSTHAVGPFLWESRGTVAPWNTVV